jgi:hypothetical protein
VRWHGLLCIGTPRSAARGCAWQLWAPVQCSRHGLPPPTHTHTTAHPQDVNVISVSAGAEHSVVATSGGQVYSFGWGEHRGRGTPQGTVGVVQGAIPHRGWEGDTPTMGCCLVWT